MRIIILSIILGLIVAEPSLFKLASVSSNANPSPSRRLDSYPTVDKINPLKVNIQVFDDRTAIDLFGSKAVKKFYIIQVRLFNNLREQSDLPSILIYSNSIELGIDLEKKYSKTNGSQCVRENSKSNNIWEKVDSHELQENILRNESKEIQLKEHSCGVTTYRPIPARSVMQSLDCKFDAKCQNILSSAMSEIEEVPFGTDKTRVLFIPKEPIQSLLPCYAVRISRIHSECFISDIAIIKKGSIILKYRTP